jgi:hypothetical protein
VLLVGGVTTKVWEGPDGIGTGFLVGCWLVVGG